MEQWYKNLVLFLPFLFAEKEFLQTFTNTIIGFSGFCALSSLSYIMNDWIDRKKDALHPVKKNRPIATGKITGKEASMVGIILGMFVLGATIKLGLFYTEIVIIYAISSSLYSIKLKNIPLIDLLLISFHFVLRMIAGMTQVPTAQTWIYFLTVFVMMIFFLSHKRRSDYKMLEGKNLHHKPVLKFYTKKRCYIIRIIAFISCIVLWYGLFTNEKITIFQYGMMIVLLGITNIIFSKKPLFVLKPYYLIKLWYWDAVVILTIAILYL